MKPCSPRRAALLRLAVACIAPAAARSADALPQRDLIVELRAASPRAGSGSAWDLSSADAARDRIAGQRVRVGNGQSASLSLSVLRPVSTWLVLPGVWRGGVAPATQWISARESLTIRPRWPGAAHPVTVALRTSSARLDPTVAPGSAEPPQRREFELETAVEVALDAWVAIATSGEVDNPRGIVVSTRDAATRELQLRVSLAP